MTTDGAAFDVLNGEKQSFLTLYNFEAHQTEWLADWLTDYFQVWSLVNWHLWDFQVTIDLKFFIHWMFEFNHTTYQNITWTLVPSTRVLPIYYWTVFNEKKRGHLYDKIYDHLTRWIQLEFNFKSIWLNQNNEKRNRFVFTVHGSGNNKRHEMVSLFEKKKENIF